MYSVCIVYTSISLNLCCPNQIGSMGDSGLFLITEGITEVIRYRMTSTKFLEPHYQVGVKFSSQRFIQVYDPKLE